MSRTTRLWPEFQPIRLATRGHDVPSDARSKMVDHTFAYTGSVRKIHELIADGMGARAPRTSSAVICPAVRFANRQRRWVPDGTVAEPTLSGGSKLRHPLVTS